MTRSGQTLLIVLAYLAFAPDEASGNSPEAPRLAVSAIDPTSPGRLAHREPLYLRIHYASEGSLRLQAKGFFKGREITAGATYNPAPPYPGGIGDGLVWISYGQPTVLDEVRITAHDANWRPLQTVSTPISMAWTNASAQPRHRPAWAASLSDQQQAMVSANIAETSDEAGWADNLFMFFMMGSVPAYFVLQIYLALRTSGRWRFAVLLPLIAMVPLLIYTVAALLAGSTLWPLLLIIVTPIAFLYLCAAGIIHAVAAKRSDG